MTTAFDDIARLKYLEWQELYEHEKPFQIFSAIPEDAEDKRSDNLVFVDGAEEIMHDIRGTEAHFSLDRNGFMIRPNESKMTEFDSEDAIKTVYLPEVEDLIRHEVDGVDLVHTFDWRIRTEKQIHQDKVNIADKMQPILPAYHVHCDQSAQGALGRVRHHFPDQADYLCRGRVRIINVWRPFDHPVEDRPLVLCDAQTVEDRDMVEIDHITRQYVGSAFHGLYSPRHRWYYLSRQTPQEVTFIKIFDSDPEVQAQNCLHASFRHSKVPENAPPRQSIELRCLVFTYPEDGDLELFSAAGNERETE